LSLLNVKDFPEGERSPTADPKKEPASGKEAGFKV